MAPTSIKILAAVILGFAISAVLGKFLIPMLRRLKAGQSIKEDGPTWHMSKQGTPTMGGIISSPSDLAGGPSLCPDLRGHRLH